MALCSLSLPMTTRCAAGCNARQRSPAMSHGRLFSTSLQQPFTAGRYVNSLGHAATAAFKLKFNFNFKLSNAQWCNGKFGTGGTLQEFLFPSFFLPAPSPFPCPPLSSFIPSLLLKVGALKYSYGVRELFCELLKRGLGQSPPAKIEFGALQLLEMSYLVETISMIFRRLNYNHRLRILCKPTWVNASVSPFPLS